MFPAFEQGTLRNSSGNSLIIFVTIFQINDKRLLCILEWVLLKVVSHLQCGSLRVQFFFNFFTFLKGANLNFFSKMGFQQFNFLIIILLADYIRS